MIAAARGDREFDLLRKDDLTPWWDATREAARSTLQMASGTKIFVTETVDELAQHDVAHTFLRVHVVSTATASLYEFRRTVCVPPLERLIPAAKIASIAEIVDA